MSRNARIALVVGAVVIAGVLFAVLRGGSNDSSSDNQSPDSNTVQKTTTAAAQGPKVDKFSITVKGDGPVGGIQKLATKKDDTVHLVVHSDKAGEVHIHGYEFERDVTAGGSVTFNFPAKLEGVFDVELHSLQEPKIGELEVSP